MASTSAVAPKNLTEWHSPSARPDTMNELIHGVGERMQLAFIWTQDLTTLDRYNPTNLQYMEDALSAQLRDGTHDLFANLAILKL
jgi:translation initiation factor 3 subunit K